MRGVGKLFPLLVRALDQSQIVALQFLPGGPRAGHRKHLGLPEGAPQVPVHI